MLIFDIFCDVTQPKVPQSLGQVKLLQEPNKFAFQDYTKSLLANDMILRMGMLCIWSSHNCNEQRTFRDITDITNKSSQN